MLSTYILPLLLSTAITTAIPASPANGIPAPAITGETPTYLILAAVIKSQWGAVPSTGSMETDTIYVKGTGPNAQLVACDATWDAKTANAKDVTVDFKCTDENVKVSMDRRNVVDFIGFDVTVSVEDQGAAVWRTKDLQTSEGWSCSNGNGELCVFGGGNGGLKITGTPTVPLQQYLTQH